MPLLSALFSHCTASNLQVTSCSKMDARAPVIYHYVRAAGQKMEERQKHRDEFWAALCQIKMRFLLRRQEERKNDSGVGIW